MREPIRTVSRKGWTRREWLRLAQVAGVGVAGAGLAITGRASASVERRHGTCRLCTMHCGIVATLRGGELARLDGDPRSRTGGFICLNGQSWREVLASRERLQQPLVRRGQTFEPTSWEDAVAEIARRVRAIVDARGPTHVALELGWPFVRHPLVSYAQRLCDGLGTPNLATVASLCESAGRMGRALTHGTDFWPRVQDAATVVLWGANPTHSAAPYYHHLMAAAKAPRALVVIDPVRTELARAATHHLAVRPGTDGALALGMLRVLISEGRVAMAHPDLPALAALVEPYTPERVEALTSVRASDVVTVARLLVDHAPAAIWDGLGVEHHDNGVQTVRAIALLYALSGGLAITGQRRPARFPSRTPAPAPAPPAAVAIGAREYPVFAQHQRQAQKQLFPAAIERGELSALFLWGSNALLTAPGSARLARAVDALELLVVVDPFLTESAQRADFVLPTALFTERPPLSVPAPGGVWSDDRLLFALGRALGLDFPWPDLEAAEAALEAERARDDAPSDDAAAHALHIRSPALEAAGLPALPVWTPPADAPDAEHPLILVSGPRTLAFINSQLHTSPTVRARDPRPRARLHPDVAAPLGITDGARVRVITRCGAVAFWAEVTADVHRDAVVVPHGWPEANANLLTDVDPLDPVSGFPAFRSRACRVERADP